MHINAQIRYLLSEEGRVSLPGIGVLTAFYEPAGADLNTDQFTPSNQRLRFNAADEPLENLVRQLGHLQGESDAKRRAKVEAFQKELQTQLESKGYALIQGIGRVRKSRGDKLTFEPDTAFNSEGISFGLESFRIEKVADKEAAGVQSGTKAEVKKKRKRDWSWGIAFIIALFIAGGIYFWGTRYFDPTVVVRMYFTPIAVSDQAVEKEQHSDAKAIDTAGQDVAKEDSLQIGDTLAVSVADTMAGDADTTAESKEEIEKIENFYIVAGVFRTNKGLNRILDRLQGMGYPAKVFKTTASGARYVCYDGYETRVQAESALEEIRETADPEAWIWPQQ